MLTGMAAATFWWAGPEVLSPSQVARGWATVGLGSVLFGVEASLFARAVLHRTRIPRTGMASG
jgi:hypothetical protein